MPNYSLLTHSTAKADKSEAFGYYSPVLYLSPSKRSGFNVCPQASGGCIASCLNLSGRGVFDNVQQARIRRTKLLFQHREEFFMLLYKDVIKAYGYAKKHHLQLAIRPDGTSDSDWSQLYTDFNDIQFYGYTKILSKLLNNRYHNLHLTFSRSEVNDLECMLALERGHNVAVVFDQLPTTWRGFEVIDGDLHDLRFLDRKGVIVGLTAKGRAKKDKTNFVVRTLGENYNEH